MVGNTVNILRLGQGQRADADTVLVTDSFPVYDKPGQEFAEHHTVDHGAKEYARTDGAVRVHSNTVEGYFSQLKRSLDGTYHHVSDSMEKGVNAVNRRGRRIASRP